MKLLGIGDNVLDDYRWRQELYPGGNSVNVPVLARRYDGSTAAYIGVLADDGAGLHFASALREEGVDISRVRVMHGISARNYIELDEAGDRHFVGNNGRETAQYQALLCLAPGDYAMMEQYDLAHTSIHSWLDAYHPAISRRVPLSLDFSGEYDRVNIAQLCPLLRCAFFSGGAASEEEVRALARTALDAGARTVVVTMGVRGSYLLEQGREHRQGVCVQTWWTRWARAMRSLRHFLRNTTRAAGIWRTQRRRRAYLPRSAAAITARSATPCRIRTGAPGSRRISVYNITYFI